MHVFHNFPMSINQKIFFYSKLSSNLGLFISTHAITEHKTGMRWHHLFLQWDNPSQQTLNFPFCSCRGIKATQEGMSKQIECWDWHRQKTSMTLLLQSLSSRYQGEEGSRPPLKSRKGQPSDMAVDVAASRQRCCAEASQRKKKKKKERWGSVYDVCQWGRRQLAEGLKIYKYDNLWHHWQVGVSLEPTLPTRNVFLQFPECRVLFWYSSGDLDTCHVVALLWASHRPIMMPFPRKNTVDPFCPS